jgi:hypothetical protein
MAISCIWPKCIVVPCDQHFAQAILAYAELRTNGLSWLDCAARMTARQRERGEIEIDAV